MSMFWQRSRWCSPSVIEQKLFLDRVVSRLIVTEKELAEELKSQILEGARFEQLAQEYSITDNRMLNGIMGTVSRGQLPDPVRALVDLASRGGWTDKN